jgi:hypothetical protein
MLQSILRKPRTAEDIAQGVRLARMSNRDIGPGDVARVLDAAKVRYVLVGAYAANGYTGKPRNTVDVDVIVEFPKKATKAVSQAFPDLRIHDTPVVTRFIRPDGEEAIDLMKPGSPPLWKKLIKLAVLTDIEGTPVRVPPVEGVLAAKLAAMTSPLRRLLDKEQDGVDFRRIAVVNDNINLKLLEELGDLVYRGGGKEILKLVADARAGKRLEF